MAQSALSLRKRVVEVAQVHDVATVEEIVVDLSQNEGVSEPAVLNAIDELERNGFVYLVDRGEETEVCVP